MEPKTPIFDNDEFGLLIVAASKRMTAIAALESDGVAALRKLLETLEANGTSTVQFREPVRLGCNWDGPITVDACALVFEGEWLFVETEEGTYNVDELFPLRSLSFSEYDYLNQRILVALRDTQAQRGK